MAIEQPLEEKRAQAFAERLGGMYTGGLLTFMVDIGYQTGLFEVAAQGSGTSKQIAERAGLNERYVREWLGAMTTGGIFTYDAVTRTYSLPPEHAVSLTGKTRRNQAPASQVQALAGKNLQKIAACFRSGGGVSYAEYQPEFADIMDHTGRAQYDELLISDYLGRATGISDRLRQGIRAVDVGCGTGHCVNIMAREYPASTFVGYDFAEDATAQASAEASAMGLSNAHFEVLDITQLPAEPKAGLITAFDAIHDQIDPATVLRRIHEALATDGTYLMVEPKASSQLEDNIGDSGATFKYSASVLYCMTVSLAHGGAGLGTVWGKQAAQQMLAETGFTQVEVVDAPEDRGTIFICRK